MLISTIKTTDRRSMETLMHSFLQPQRVGEHNQELFDVEPEFVKKLFKTVKKLKRALSNEKTVVKLEALNPFDWHSSNPCGCNSCVWAASFLD